MAWRGFGLGGKDRAAQSSLEQPVLARSAPATHRTTLFAYYNVIGGLASAVGALCSGAPVVLEQVLGIDLLDGYQLMFFLYAGVGAVVTVVYLRLSPAAEASAVDGRRVGITLPRRSKGIIYRLAALGAMDSFGGGFMFQTFLAYWFTLRYDLSLESLAGVFFTANIISSFSAILAAWLSRRIGLINTMVWTHIPANLLVVAMAFSAVCVADCRDAAAAGVHVADGRADAAVLHDGGGGPGGADGGGGDVDAGPAGRSDERTLHLRPPSAGVDDQRASSHRRVD